MKAKNPETDVRSILVGARRNANKHCGYSPMMQPGYRDAGSPGNPKHVGGRRLARAGWGRSPSCSPAGGGAQQRDPATQATALKA